MTAPREGNLEAPTRHPIDWKNPQFYDEEAAFTELERIFDICHGCRRCVRGFACFWDLGGSRRLCLSGFLWRLGERGRSGLEPR